jgi:hypothetical protein
MTKTVVVELSVKEFGILLEGLGWIQDQVEGTREWTSARERSVLHLKKRLKANLELLQQMRRSDRKS